MKTQFMQWWTQQSEFTQEQLSAHIPKYLYNDEPYIYLAKDCWTDCWKWEIQCNMGHNVITSYLTDDISSSLINDYWTGKIVG